MSAPTFFSELKRRNVWRAAVLYIGAIWALAQGISQLGPSFGMPDWGTRWFVIAAVIGFPFWVAFAWFYEWTPEGFKREREVEPGESITPHTGRKLDFIIVGVMAVVIVLLLTDRFVLHHGVNEDVAAPDRSVAVLPFVNMSSDKEQEYFSDGLTEELLNLLSKVPNLQVTARTSSFAFKGQNLGIPEIAHRLHVANVLEGSVRKAGTQLRITAQLIHAADGYHLWSQTWDRQLDDIFAVQDEIAATVVKELKVSLLGAAPIAKPVDPRAYPLILQAQALTDQQSAAGLTRAIDLYRQALAIAPNEPRAWAGLSRVYFNQGFYGEIAAAEGAALAKEAASKAAELDPDNATALALLGRLAADFELDLPTAARYYQQALEREPGNPGAINAAAVLLDNIGRFDEALALLEDRAARDPANPTAFNNLGTAHYYARHWDAAIDQLRIALRLSPQFATAHFQIGGALLLGRHDAAGALKEYEAEPDELTRILGLAMALHTLDRHEEADAAFKALIEKYAKDQAGAIAVVYAYRGQADAAFEWLDKAAAVHDPQLSTILAERLLDPLHGDARWLPYLRKIGYAPEQLAKIEFKVTLPQ